MSRFKLMILSDSPSGLSGLGRITRELALRIHEHLSEEIEVCTYALGPIGSSTLPFKQYEMKAENLVPLNLPATWRDFAGDERGAVMAIYNVSWIPFFTFPDKCPNESLRDFIKSKPCSFWTYTPIDGDCRPGMLPLNMAEALHGFDRVAHYTKFAQRITNASWKELGLSKETAVLPHGLDPAVFYPRDRAEARKTFYERATGEPENPIKEDVRMIGVIATNSERKSWPLAFETAAKLVRRGVNVGLWIHTDHPRKHFDMLALVREFKLEGRIVFSRPLNDDELAWCYSAMDVTWGPGNEGWGYPLAESLACGVPVIHMSYGGGADFVSVSMQVDPVAFVRQGFFGVRKPVFSARDWADMTTDWLEEHADVDVPEYIKWENAWEAWKTWILEGIK